MNGAAMDRTFPNSRSVPKQPLRSVMQRSPKGGNDVMRDGNGGWGAQNERGRHGQNVPKQPLRLVMQGSQKGGNDVMRDGNGGWGAQNERGRHGQNVPKQPSAQLCKGLRKAEIWCSASGAYSEASILHDESSGTAAGRLPCGANSAIQLTQLNFHGVRYRRDHHL